MIRKLAVVILVIVTFCMITPGVYANAETQHGVWTTENSETFTAIFDLPPTFAYTQVNITAIMYSKLSYLYNMVIDANGKTHVNGKFTIEGSGQFESWFWNDTQQEWVFGQISSRTSKRITGYNELILESETQTNKDFVLFKERVGAEGIDPASGETFTLDYMIIDHVMTKWVNGELLFENSWEIVKGESPQYT